MKARVCVLCNEEASLYCASDSAFLCCSCDARVHGANFLVARHIRSSLCSECQRFTGDTFSGVEFQPGRPICRSCSSETSSHLDSMSSSSSSCVSTTKSAPKDGAASQRKAEAAGRNSRHRQPSSVSAEGILVNWCRKLGLNGNCATAAVHALGVCFNKFTVLPPRVSLAAAAWCGAKLSGDRSAYTYQNLKRLAAISGVPAKLILAVELKLARAMSTERPPAMHHQEEGWGECS